MNIAAGIVLAFELMAFFRAVSDNNSAWPLPLRVLGQNLMLSWVAFTFGGVMLVKLATTAAASRVERHQTQEVGRLAFTTAGEPLPDDLPTTIDALWADARALGVRGLLRATWTALAATRVGRMLTRKGSTSADNDPGPAT